MVENPNKHGSIDLSRLPSGIYNLDIRHPIEGLITPNGGLVIEMRDGRIAIIAPAPNTIQL